MRRIGAILILLSAVLCSEGCRRNVTRRDPISVRKEGEFIYTKSMDDTISKFTPPPKEGEGQVDPKVQEGLQKLKEQKEKEQKEKNFQDIGNEYVKFAKKMKPTELSLDKFKTHIRRTKNDKLRFDELDPGAVKAEFMCLLNQPGHILVYRTSAQEGSLPIFEVGMNRQAVASTVRDKQLDDRLKKQELEAMLFHVWEFSKTSYVNTPSDPWASGVIKGYLSNNVPWAALNGIRTYSDNKGRTLVQYLKKTPDKRDAGKFRRYLLDSAPPDFLKALDDNRMRVSVVADLADPAHLVAAYSVASEGKGRGHKAITSNSTISEYNQQTIDQWFPAQKGQPKMGMPPGGMPPGGMPPGMP
jgi:hypothetical protein